MINAVKNYKWHCINSWGDKYATPLIDDSNDTRVYLCRAKEITKLD